MANSVLMSLSKVVEEECPKRSVPHEIISYSYSDVTNDASSAETLIYLFGMSPYSSEEMLETTKKR